jgi:hypothetical protein
LCRRGGKGEGESAQGEDGAQDCDRVHVGLEVVGWNEVFVGLSAGVLEELVGLDAGGLGCC